jgi:hypothetical protein
MQQPKFRKTYNREWWLDGYLRGNVPGSQMRDHLPTLLRSYCGQAEGIERTPHSSPERRHRGLPLVPREGF